MNSNEKKVAKKTRKKAKKSLKSAKKSPKNTQKSSKKAHKKVKKTTAKSKPIKPGDVITAQTTQNAMSLLEIVKFNNSLDDLHKYKFKPEYIKGIETHMSLGMTLFDYAKKIGVHRDTIERWSRCHPSFKDAVIRGVSTFVKSLPAKLLKHRAEGRSFESFAHIAGRSKTWLYELVRVDDEFREAAERSYSSALFQWEGLMIAQASGRLVRVSKERIRTNKNGDAMIDPNTGEVLTDKTYVPAMGSDRTLSFAMQSLFEEYRTDTKDSQQALHDELKGIMEAADKEELLNKQRGKR